MLNEKFILEHMDEIAELRDFAEIYEYFLANGVPVNAAEIMALKDSSNLGRMFETNDQVLTIQQLDCVAGGWSNGDTALTLGIIAGVALIAFGIAACATGNVGTGVECFIGAGFSIGSGIYSKVSENNALQATAQNDQEPVQLKTQLTAMNNCVG